MPGIQNWQTSPLFFVDEVFRTRSRALENGTRQLTVPQQVSLSSYSFTRFLSQLVHKLFVSHITLFLLTRTSYIVLCYWFTKLIV